jgi:hypothetical protein
MLSLCGSFEHAEEATVRSRHGFNERAFYWTHYNKDTSNAKPAIIASQ